MSDTEINITELNKRLEEINKLKKLLDSMKLVSRPDVQIIHSQLSNINRDILFATQDKESKEAMFKNATICLNNLHKTKDNLTAHLELIKKAHVEHKEKTLETLMKKLNSN
jgi:hypothetical protein